jgi:hypothetical protein
MTPAEIAAAVQALQLLEPYAQKAVIGLIHLLHKPQMTADDYMQEAQALLQTSAKGGTP